ADSKKALVQATDRQIKYAAGTEAFLSRDPVYHINEQFRQTFDFVGKNAARRLGAETEKNNLPESDGRETEVARPERKRFGASRAETGAARDDASSDMDGRTDMRDVYKPAPGEENQNFINRFSQTAFGRGDMSGAVIRGTGEMMLLSCLKRTVCQSQPKNFRQRTLFNSSASTKRNVRGYEQDKVIFNKGEANSAVGIVIDAVQSAGRTVEMLADLLEGNDSLPDGSGADTLFRQYPFLTDKKERELLAGYRETLDRLHGPEAADKRAILDRAIIKTQALIEKKQQLRNNFTQHLRFLSNRAMLASEVFNDEAFSQMLLKHLEEYSPAPPPPDDDGRNRKEAEEGRNLQEEDS
ncbi:MAG: hypothetical protein LBH28_09700, partial [Oscillospiraceae bacterium]|nr:hypothetical protein [Oscillospiraceae bacterium]